MIKDSFAAYGKVVDVVIMYDHEKQKSRGFGFLSFENEDAVDRVCQEQYVEVAGKKVEVKKAEPRDTKLMMAAMSGLAIPPALLSGANAFGMTSIPTLPGAHLAGYSHLQQSPVTGLTLLPATGPALFPLTVGGNGVVPGGLGGAGLASSGFAGLAPGGHEAEPIHSWHGNVVSAASPYYSSALAGNTAVNGAGAYTALVESQGPERAAQVPGAYSAIGAGYGGMALPLGFSDGQSHYPAMLQARSLTTAQAFHPYRRAEDGR